MALLSILTINYLRWNGVEPDWGYHPENLAYLLLQTLNAWCWVLALLGYGKRYLNVRSRVLDYANEAVYPFYILHQTVIVVLAYFVVQTPESIAAKYVFTAGLSLALTLGIYHVWIRDYPLMRLLFGMKPARRAAAPAPARAAPRAALEPAA